MAYRSAKRRVGILGGMGPEATVYLLSRIISMTEAHDDSDHVPLLVDSNTQVPSRIKALIERTGADPGPVLVDMARRLEEAGVEGLAMACNTAHHYAPLICKSVSIPFLDMVDLSAEAAVQMLDAPLAGCNEKVGILASPAVQMTGLFDRAFGSRGLETAYSSDPDSMLTCIRAIKAHGGDAQTRAQLGRAAAELQARGCGAVVIACSELSIIQDAIPPDIAMIDTVDILAKAVVTFAST